MFFALILSVLYLFRKYIVKHRLPAEETDGIEGLADTDLMCVPFKGEWVTLQRIDYLNRWLHMNRKQRSEILESQKKAIKQGKAKKHFFGDGKMYQIVATEKSHEFTKIHAIKEEIYLSNKSMNEKAK